jgi:hypothetical protein
MRLVFETDRYWLDNVQYSLIKIGDRKEFPVIVNFRFLPQCSFSFTERLKFYVSLIFLSMQVDGASYRDRRQKSTGHTTFKSTVQLYTIRLFRIRSIPIMFRVFRVWTSEMLGRDLARILRPLVTFAEQIFFFYYE